MKEFFNPEIKVYEIATEEVSSGNVSMVPGVDDGDE